MDNRQADRDRGRERHAHLNKQTGRFRKEMIGETEVLRDTHRHPDKQTETEGRRKSRVDGEKKTDRYAGKQRHTRIHPNSETHTPRRTKGLFVCAPCSPVPCYKSALSHNHSDPLESLTPLDFRNCATEMALDRPLNRRSAHTPATPR